MHPSIEAAVVWYAVHFRHQFPEQKKSGSKFLRCDIAMLHPAAKPEKLQMNGGWDLHIFRESKCLPVQAALHQKQYWGKKHCFLPHTDCSATSFLRNWDSILEKKRANLRSISEPARLRQPPPRSTGAAHARGRAQSIREERRIAAPPVLFALLWVRLLPALYGPFCGPLRPFGGWPWGVTPPARECLPPAPPDTRRRG